MADKKRCFSTIRGLNHLHPGLLCQVFSKFPDYIRERQLHLPDSPDPKHEDLDYHAIHDACMDNGIPHELDDLLFHASVLGTQAGWDKIQREAQFQGCHLRFSTHGLTHPDLAMMAWLHDWPNNRHLLEASYARAKIHRRSSYVYFAPVRDLRKRYKSPDKAAISKLRKELAVYFVTQELGKGTNLVVYEYDKEIWFLIKYPGQVERHPSIDNDGQPQSAVFKPEEYDAVVYHKIYGDLRLNTNRTKEHIHYRIAFGSLLLNTNNAFNPKEEIVQLAPLQAANCDTIFACKDILGLAEIVPVEVCFSCLSRPDQVITWQANKDHHLLEYYHGKSLLPDDTTGILQAKFRYRLKDHTKYDTVTVHSGKTLNYERDGDSAVLEDFLRRRLFIKDVLGMFKK